MSTSVRALAVAGMIWSGVAAQSPSGPPTPTAAEHKRLEFFVGKWRGEMTEKESAGAATKAAVTDTCEWFDGHFHVVCRVESDGNDQEMNILSYSTTRREYSWYNIDNHGNSVSITGHLQGKAWKWVGDGGNPKGPKFDIAWTETSADSYTVLVTMTEPAGKPTTVLQGTMNRVK